MNHSVVLYVEDEEDDAVFMRQAWRKSGLDNPLVIVSDGEQARAYLSGSGGFGDRQRHPLPELVLLDVNLPKLSGLELLKWIRRQPMIEKLPVILFSGAEEAAETRREQAALANALRAKPASGEGFVELTNELKTSWF